MWPFRQRLSRDTLVPPRKGEERKMNRLRRTMILALLGGTSLGVQAGTAHNTPRYRVFNLPSLSTAGPSEGNSINNLGLAAGTSTVASGATHATAWLLGTAYDLKT